MRRVRHIAVWTLLATLVVGGVAGPSIHRVDHALQKMAQASEEPCHSSAVHNTDVPLWTRAGASVHVPDCDLCATRLIVVLPDINPASTPSMAGTTRVVLRTHLTAAHVAAHRTIRGPPVFSGARPV